MGHSLLPSNVHTKSYPPVVQGRGLDGTPLSFLYVAVFAAIHGKLPL